MSDDPRHLPASAAILDAKGLRALAHPLRVQLIGLLRKYGPSTATRLAERLGVNSGAASYHLRQLGAAGFVEEDTERGNGRDRWWRAVHESTWFTDMDLVEREPEATLAYLQSIAAAHTLRTQRALNEFETMPREWRERLELSDWSLRLTPEETETLYEEFLAVLRRFRKDEPGVQAPDGAERVSVMIHGIPELDTPPRS